ncbi:MAG: AraC family transcriptional regulator [Bacteroides sp.]|nr:AraC family transcriptional regulator [Bacteroides sp.]MBD5337391.1 AraC family transcriptional regulator [Bacteroides sp.]
MEISDIAPDNLIEVSFHQLIDKMKCASYANEIALLNVKAPFETVSNPIRIDTMVIGLCIKGRARVKIDLREYSVGPQSLLPINPKHYLTVLEMSPDFEALAIMASRQVFESIMPKLTELLPLMLNMPPSPIAALSESEYVEIMKDLRFLESKMNLPDSPFKGQKIITLLQSTLLEMLEFHHRRSDGAQFKKSRKEEIMARFIISVSEHFRDHRDVTFYANDLCITPKHLSAVVKELSGRPAGDWIDQYVIMEAKVLLRSTDYSVQQIASILHFANQSFFGKYFKHIVGVSPSAFRNSMM